MPLLTTNSFPSSVIDNTYHKSTSSILTSSNIVTNNHTRDTGNQNNDTVWMIIGIAVPTLIGLTTIAVITLVLFVRKSSQRKSECDNSYSILSRGPTQQLQSQLLDPASVLYDRIELSPSTGQAEFISKTETDNKNNPSPHHNQYGIHHSVDTEQPKSATMQISDSSLKNIPSHDNEYTNEQPTYAVFNKERKNEKEPVHCPFKSSAATSLTLKQNSTHNNIEIQDNNTAKKVSLQTAKSLEELYTAVKKKTKESTAQNEEEPPPIPLQGVEQLYTAVNKKTQRTTANDEVESPPIPPQTVEELYTAVMKKPKVRETDDEVEAPPVPPHTVEELYTAVQKNTK